MATCDFTRADYAEIEAADYDILTPTERDDAADLRAGSVARPSRFPETEAEYLKRMRRERFEAEQRERKRADQAYDALMDARDADPTYRPTGFIRRAE